MARGYWYRVPGNVSFLGSVARKATFEASPSELQKARLTVKKLTSMPRGTQSGTLKQDCCLGVSAEIAKQNIFLIQEPKNPANALIVERQAARCWRWLNDV
jgi:hypothetical protein